MLINNIKFVLDYIPLEKGGYLSKQGVQTTIIFR